MPLKKGRELLRHLVRRTRPVSCKITAYSQVSPRTPRFSHNIDLFTPYFLVGHTVDEAAYLFSALENQCRVQLMVEAAAANRLKKRIIDNEVSYLSSMHFSVTDLHIWLSGRAIYCKYNSILGKYLHKLPARIPSAC